MEKERRHASQLENELKFLRIKHDGVCERVSTATHQLERVKMVLEQTTRRCEQLEKEKVRRKCLASRYWRTSVSMIRLV